MTRAKRRTPLSGSRTTTARLSERSEMYGNGCAGSTASGVRTGNTRSSNTSWSSSRCAFFSSSQSVIRIRSACSCGCTSFSKTCTWRATSSCARARIASSCSRGLIPSGDVPRTPAASCSRRPDTRIWKNSSRFRLKIARNRARSSGGRGLVLGAGEDPRVVLERGELAVQEPRLDATSGSGRVRRSAQAVEGRSLSPSLRPRGCREKYSSAVLVFVCCSPARSTPFSVRYARVSAATWKASAGAHFVDSSRIRRSSG